MSERHLDRRRLAETWYRCKLITWIGVLGLLDKTPLNLKGINFDACVLQHLPKIESAFLQKWTGSYHLSNHFHDFCAACIVIDGHFKIKRSVCAYTYEQHIESEELGPVKTGCPNTPKLHSYYCEDHDKHAVERKPETHEHDTPQSEVDPCNENNVGTDYPEFYVPIKAQSKFIIIDILNKRNLNSGIEYEVLWDDNTTSWMKSNDVPQDWIRKYQASSREQRAARRQAERGFFEISEEEKADLDSLECNTLKEKQYAKRKHRTAGICLAAYNCGIIIHFVELFGSESLSQVYCFLVRLYSQCVLPLSLAYDDGCHLAKFARNAKRAASTAVAGVLALLTIVVDRMHFKGHKDKWCKKHMNPDKHKEFDRLNTESCEQTFSWGSGYSSMTRHMNYPRYHLFLFSMFDMYNEDKL